MDDLIYYCIYAVMLHKRKSPPWRTLKVRILKTFWCFSSSGAKLRVEAAFPHYSCEKLVVVLPCWCHKRDNTSAVTIGERNITDLTRDVCQILLLVPKNKGARTSFLTHPLTMSYYWEIQHRNSWKVQNAVQLYCTDMLNHLSSSLWLGNNLSDDKYEGVDGSISMKV